MKNSTIALIAVMALVIAGIGWWAMSLPGKPSQQAQTGQQNASSATSSTTSSPAATSSPAVPGDNLTLGQEANAKVGKYLIGYNGMTLYRFAPDVGGVSYCQGGCTKVWPPYIVTSAANLVAESPISGAIGTITRADGSLQVTYDGHPLYFYSGDTQSGDTNGQGIGGAWVVVKP